MALNVSTRRRGLRNSSKYTFKRQGHVSHVLRFAPPLGPARPTMRLVCRLKGSGLADPILHLITCLVQPGRAQKPAIRAFDGPSTAVA